MKPNPSYSEREIGRIDALDLLDKILAHVPVCPSCHKRCSVMAYATACDEAIDRREAEARHAMTEKMGMQPRRVMEDGRLVFGEA